MRTSGGIAAAIALAGLFASGAAAQEPSPLERAAPHLRAAEEEPLRRSEHLAAAIAALEGAPGIESDVPSIVRLASLQLDVGRRGEAARTAERALALASDDPGALARAADVDLARGDPASAASRYERAIAIGERERASWRASEQASWTFRQAELRTRRARALLRSRLYAAARDEARRAVEGRPGDADARSLLAWCEARLAHPIAAPDEARVPGFLVRSAVGAWAARRAAARLAEVVPEMERRFPLEGVLWRELHVYLVGEEAFAALAPRGAQARAFYQRDEQAVFAIAEDADEADRLVVHECFHAHLHRIAEDVPPWLDEGWADVLASWPDPHPVRARDLRAAIARGRPMPLLRDLAARTRVTMVEDDGIYVRFAAAWGWVDFLRAEEPALLERYTKKVLAGASAEEAYEAAFGGVDPTTLAARMRARFAK